MLGNGYNITWLCFFVNFILLLACYFAHVACTIVLMQPDYEAPSQYDFILSHGEKPKRSFLPGGNSFKSRVLLVVGGAVVLMLVAFVVMSLFFKGSGQTDKLVSLAAQQTEIARIAELGAKNAKSPDTRNFAVTTSLALTSSGQDIKELLKKQGRKLDAKELAAKKNSETDKKLEAAANANRYDEVFLEILNSQLNSYKQAVKELHASSTQKSEKELLNKSYRQAAIILNTKN